MALDDLTLDQLRTFDAVVRDGSFAAAARRLHRVPSAVSYTIRHLEDALGVALFDRSGHRVTPTAAAARLHEHARRVLDHTHQLHAVAHEVASGWEPGLRIVVDAALPRSTWVAGLAALATDGVPTAVRLYEETQEGVVDRFLNDEGDIMAVLAEDGRVADHPWGPLAALEMVLVAAATHPLAGASALERSDLDAHVSLVTMDSARRYADTPRDAYLDTQRRLYVGSFDLKRALLLAATGFGWMPAHLVADDLAAGTLALLAGFTPHRWTYHPRLVFRADRPPGPAAQRLLEVWGVVLDRGA